MRSPTARSLIVDLLSTLAGGSMPAAALVEAGALFGIRAGSVRVALARLLAEGRIERRGRGRYRLGAASEPLHALVRSWRRLAERTRPWSGAWLCVHLGPGAARADRARSLRALRLLGFAELRGGLHLRPSNLAEAPARSRETLLALGLEPEALWGVLDSLDSSSASRARELWDSRLLERFYRERRTELDASARRLPGLDANAAMAESFLLGGQAIQALVRDPLLPPEIHPARERDALVETLRSYDALGRACWAPLLERFDVLHRDAPQDTRVATALDRLRA